METSTGVLTREDSHATYLDRSRKELQRRVEQLRRALKEENEKLAVLSKKQQSRTNVNGAAVGTREHLDAVAEAYRNIAGSEPLLPFPDSVLPALIALRTTNSTITESRIFLASQQISLQESQDRLGAEQANFSDQKALTRALENRIQSLRDGIASRTAMSPGQIAREKISELKQQIKDTDADRSRLLSALKGFIDEPLASMLAAEQIGGPVAGDMMDVDSDTLEAGFSTAGKRKKAKADTSSNKRQRRIDDMLGGGAERPGEDGAPELNRRTAARDEMQELVEELMNKLTAADGSTSDAYVNIPEESAAVRFLTRVKVAEFHPRDSKRLRLVDFGREIED